MAIDAKAFVEKNKANATAAAYLEAGRLANIQLLKMVKPKIPVLARGYVDTPVGKLIMANLLSLAVEQVKPENEKARQLSEAMICQAYQEAFSSLDLESILDEFFNSAALSKSFAKLGTGEAQLTK